ncbi:hypothetical protein BC940DRAFT_306358 [Gongronella butleri]|nr:hypothetical protein BC940DRAFT_306358 [Gongronella butleri]
MTLAKRQDSLADSCSQMGNGYPYCQPTSTDVWVNGSHYEFVWNYNFPYYVLANALDLHLYYIQNYQMVEVKNWTNLPTSQGELAVQVDDSWFPSPSYGSSKNWTLYGLYVPAGSNATNVLLDHNTQFPKQFNFTAIQGASPSPSSTGSTASTNGASANGNGSSSAFPGWGIALVVIVVVAVLITAGVLAWVCCVYRPRRRRQMEDMQKQQEKAISAASPGIGGDDDDEKVASGFGGDGAMMGVGVGIAAGARSMDGDDKADSIYSHTPMLKGAAATRSSVSVHGNTGSSIFHHNNNDHASHHLPSLTSQDAVALGENFRHWMQTPDWSSLDEDVDEERRRRLGEELLQRQLAEDGATIVQQQQPTRKTSIASRTPKPRTAAIMVADSTASLSQSSSMASIAHAPNPPPPPPTSSS